MVGLVLVSTEGINGTVAGTEEVISQFKEFLIEVADSDIHFKDSVSELQPFKRATVDIRSEIVGMKRPDLVPESPENQHLTPTEWNEVIESGEPYLLIDTRNDYETKIGKFKGAIDPGLKSFGEWGDYLRNSEIPKDTHVLIYCTGGIRCEKAILEMQEQGFEKVNQLKDGILGYLAEYPEGYWEGECFVFDDRVAVDANLAPTSTYGICPCCGLVGSNKVVCNVCNQEFFTCDSFGWKGVCSKTCKDWRDKHPL